MLNFIAIDLQLYKIFKIMLVSFLGHVVYWSVISPKVVTHVNTEQLSVQNDRSHCEDLMTVREGAYGKPFIFKFNQRLQNLQF